MFAIRSILILCAAFLAIPVSLARAEPKYPIVFTSPGELVPFGIFIRSAGDTSPIPSNFKTRCFDGSDIMSGEPEFLISDQMMAKHRAKGFTRDSLCMALSSRTTFDPETGRRLPTYILRDQKAIVRSLEQRLDDARGGKSLPTGVETVEAFAAAIESFKREDYSKFSKDQLYELLAAERGLTWERPLVVPSCYKNATPYLDCDWKFGVGKGKPYGDKKTAREFGTAIDKQMKDAIASGKPLVNAAPDAGEMAFSKFELESGLYEGQPEAVKVPKVLREWEKSIDWIMVSKGLPRGYGYAYQAFRFPDGAFTLNSVDPQLSSKKLKPQSLLDIIASYF